MKVYAEHIENDKKIVKIFGIKIYSRVKRGSVVKIKYLFGLYKIRKQPDLSKYYICGIQIAYKRNNTPISTYNYTNAFIMEYFLDKQYQKYKDTGFDILGALNNSKTVLISATDEYIEQAHGWYKYFFNGNIFGTNTLPYDNKGADLYVLLGGIAPKTDPRIIIVEAMVSAKPVLITESTFISSINTFCESKDPAKYRYNIGIVVDYLTAYYDGTRQSYLEKMLNDKNLVITDKQKQRARKCIDKIIENHLTKYNCQPIFEPEIGRKGAQKVLVVDQSFSDNSIKKGMASIATFDEMLKKAIAENPDADIIVKTHPDTKTGKRTGYYTDLQEIDNIYLYTNPINPISLIKYVDKVYVCSTQMGFEAVMCGKETHVFGMPFYAGWGLTLDEQTCSRRTNKRTLEEVFYITYILYSYYVNPDKQCRCEIEEAIDYLLELRKEYEEYKLSL